MTQILEQLEINQTFLYQFVLFGVFYILLSQLYFKPFQRLLKKREHKLTSELQGSSDLIRNIENRLSDYERELASARGEALRNYEKSIADARAKEETALNSYKDELKKDFMKAFQQLQGEKEKVEAELSAQVSQLADALVQKTLGGK